MESVLPAALSAWHDRIAVIEGSGVYGHLLIEAVTCGGHGDAPVAELEWTARLMTGPAQPTYTGGLRLDWSQALAELAGGTCSWLDEPCRVTWLPADTAAGLRYELFD